MLSRICSRDSHSTHHRHSNSRDQQAIRLSILYHYCLLTLEEEASGHLVAGSTLVALVGRIPEEGIPEEDILGEEDHPEVGRLAGPDHSSLVQTYYWY